MLFLEFVISHSRLPNGQVEATEAKKDQKWVQKGTFLAN